MQGRIHARERAAVLQSLAAGVVPRLGIQHIQVGRKAEVEALLGDIHRIENGGASIRFIVGRFGAGKSFFLNLMQQVALERKFVVLRADFTTQRRLHATGGEGRALYQELMRNMSTRARPDGGALASVVERWIGEIEHDAQGDPDETERRIVEVCRELQEFVSGFDFTAVLQAYYRGHHTGNADLQAAALRWLRGEYSTKTEARADLGVRGIIDDANYYDYLKLMASWLRSAGYAGLLVCLDELVVVSHRLNNRLARNNNYEAILRILNDCLQGTVSGLGFLFGATDECVYDTRRGLFSYEALASRLAPNRFAKQGLVDLNSPVLPLQNLSPEDCYVLLLNVRRVHAGGEPEKSPLPEEAIEAYLQSCAQRMGAAYFQTPRETIKDFVGLLNVLDQNPGADWKALVGAIDTTVEDVQTQDPALVAAPASAVAAGEEDDDLASFQL
ncbi:ATP-binding protein [bacterium]|nr:MAG: ATP-binding protein [bacterium]